MKSALTLRQNAAKYRTMKIIHFFAAAMLLATSALLADGKTIAKTEIGRQFDLLKKGDVSSLRARFTDRQKERVTADKVKKAQKEIRKYTLDDLVESVLEGEYDGKKTIKIKMKNGRTLTTLVEENGQWLADTIWFR